MGRTLGTWAPTACLHAGEAWCCSGAGRQRQRGVVVVVVVVLLLFWLLPSLAPQLPVLERGAQLGAAASTSFSSERWVSDLPSSGRRAAAPAGGGGISLCSGAPPPPPPPTHTHPLHTHTRPPPPHHHHPARAPASTQSARSPTGRRLSSTGRQGNLASESASGCASVSATLRACSVTGGWQGEEARQVGAR